VAPAARRGYRLRVNDTPLSVTLEAALVRALAAAWQELNQSHFKGALKAPAIRLADGATRLGQWHRMTRTLELSRTFVIGAGWGQVVEVLKHEMAHQYVAEVLGEPDESAHGPAFRTLCARLGIDARAAGLPASLATDENGAPAASEARILHRIAKLLALAGSSNAHEAELAMAEAQRLMLKHNLEAGPGAGYGFRHLGRPTGRTTESERLLAGILGEHFFVEAIWVPVWRPLEGKRGSVLEVCGSSVNLEMAAYVHAFLTQTAERLWGEYRRERSLASNRDRRTFLAGVMAGFRDKLESERTRHRKEGLIWIGDGDLHRYFRRRHPYVRTARYGGAQANEAHADGRAAGRNVVLHRPVASSPGQSGRLLPPRR
jgi:hypothetical protein